MIGGELGTFGLNDIVEIGNILQEARRQQTLAASELGYCDSRQNDLLHEIELGSANHLHLGKLAKELREIRKRRRIAKNTIKIVKPILDWCDNNNNIRNKLYNAIGETRKIDKEINECEYHYKTEDDKVIEHVED